MYTFLLIQPVWTPNRAMKKSQQCYEPGNACSPRVAQRYSHLVPPISQTRASGEDSGQLFLAWVKCTDLHASPFFFLKPDMESGLRRPERMSAARVFLWQQAAVRSVNVYGTTCGETYRTWDGFFPNSWQKEWCDPAVTPDRYIYPTSRHQLIGSTRATVN